MDVTKMPAPGTGSANAPSSAAEQGAQPPARTAAIADRADIRPLDIVAALQILLAEVRASFEAIVMGGDTGAAGAESPTQAARVLLQMVLQALPDETASSPAWNALGNAPGSALAWSAAQTRVDAALQAGIDRAISVVTACATCQRASWMRPSKHALWCLRSSATIRRTRSGCARNGPGWRPDSNDFGVVDASCAGIWPIPIFFRELR